MNELLDFSKPESLNMVLHMIHDYSSTFAMVVKDAVVVKHHMFLHFLDHHDRALPVNHAPRRPARPCQAA